MKGSRKFFSFILLLLSYSGNCLAGEASIETGSESANNSGYEFLYTTFEGRQQIVGLQIEGIDVTFDIEDQVTELRDLVSDLKKIKHWLDEEPGSSNLQKLAVNIRADIEAWRVSFDKRLLTHIKKYAPELFSERRTMRELKTAGIFTFLAGLGASIYLGAHADTDEGLRLAAGALTVGWGITAAVFLPAHTLGSIPIKYEQVQGNACEKILKSLEIPK
jgi:hypothetical protein